MLDAWRNLRRIQREQAALFELQGAQNATLLANINRDSKKQPKPFTINDFTFFNEKAEKASGPLSALVAAVAMELRHEDKTPPLLLAAWDQVLASLKDGTKTPEVRALHSADDAVWVLAPSWEGRNCRGGLVMVKGRCSGPVPLRDIDRPLNRYELVVPERKGLGWLEGELLLLAAET